MKHLTPSPYELPPQAVRRQAPPPPAADLCSGGCGSHVHRRFNPATGRTSRGRCGRCS